MTFLYHKLMETWKFSGKVPLFFRKFWENFCQKISAGNFRTHNPSQDCLRLAALLFNSDKTKQCTLSYYVTLLSN